MGWTVASLLIPAAAIVVAVLLHRSCVPTSAWVWFTAVFGVAALALLLNPVTFDAYVPVSHPELSAGQGLNLRGLSFLVGGGPAGALTAIIVFFAVVIRVADDRTHETHTLERTGS
ncbi:hypothetical protein [Orlajensenia leifsoniae]|uniref:Uncharacterized protein n=1 Tax=Orlajensenia leifsoniae TaxID=2561933 RepID=A0A4Y9R6H2_9MICO|nr:hypothetical protein [Leifsonia flava]TFV99897.1 hypothetical protein E4M00_01455 [Leifsonia flava]